jgi:hypothetical protein
MKHSSPLYLFKPVYGSSPQQRLIRQFKTACRDCAARSALQSAIMQMGFRL